MQSSRENLVSWHCHVSCNDMFLVQIFTISNGICFKLPTYLVLKELCLCFMFAQTC